MLSDLFVCPDMTNKIPLLYADDLIILSRSKPGLQNCLNTLQSNCKSWTLKISWKTVLFQKRPVTCIADTLNQLYTAVSRKVVGKSERDNPERYCGWFLDHCFLNKFQRVAREVMDVCLRGLKESNKSRFDSNSVKNKCINHMPYYLSGLSHAQLLRQPFSK